MRQMTTIAALAGLLAVSGSALAESPSTKPAPQAPAAASASPCVSQQHAAFDFWVGQWDVRNAAGALAGRSNVERVLDGCVIRETWTSAAGGYAGMSFNTLDPGTGTWMQHWVDNGGMSAIMTGRFEEKNLVYHREFKGKNGTPLMARMTFFNLEPGKVRQLVEQSADGGKSWTRQIDLTYTRAGSTGGGAG